MTLLCTAIPKCIGFDAILSPDYTARRIWRSFLFIFFR